MDRKKFLQATLAGGITMWILAGLWHELVMASFYTSETHAKHEGIGIILLAYILLGLLMAYLYPLAYRGGQPLREGVRFGAIVGILWVLPHELAMAGAHGESISYVFKNAAWHTIEQGIGGIVIGFVYGGLNITRRTT